MRSEQEIQDKLNQKLSESAHWKERLDTYEKKHRTDAEYFEKRDEIRRNLLISQIGVTALQWVLNQKEG